MNEDSLQLVTIALQLLETVMRLENIEIGIATTLDSVDAYDTKTLSDIASVKKKVVME